MGDASDRLEAARRRAAVVALLVCTALGCSGPLREAPSTSHAMATAPEPLLSDVRQLTFVGRRAGEGYYGADGRRLVFQSERDPDNPFFQIHLFDLETGDVRRISPGTGKSHPARARPPAPGSTRTDGARCSPRRTSTRTRGRSRHESWKRAHRDARSATPGISTSTTTCSPRTSRAAPRSPAESRPGAAP
jgi:hypothetical protein